MFSEVYHLRWGQEKGWYCVLQNYLTFTTRQGMDWMFFPLKFYRRRGSVPVRALGRWSCVHMSLIVVQRSAALPSCTWDQQKITSRQVIYNFLRPSRYLFFTCSILTVRTSSGNLMVPRIGGGVGVTMLILNLVWTPGWHSILQPWTRE